MNLVLDLRASAGPVSSGGRRQAALRIPADGEEGRCGTNPILGLGNGEKDDGNEANSMPRPGHPLRSR